MRVLTKRPMSDFDNFARCEPFSDFAISVAATVFRGVPNFLERENRAGDGSGAERRAVIMNLWIDRRKSLQVSINF